MNQDIERLAGIAGKLGRRGPLAKTCWRAMPRLWLMTDPRRTPDPAAIARRLPAGAAIVYRAFGAGDALLIAVRLRAITRARKQLLLIGADARLAMKAHADGVHLPERLAALAPRLRRAHPRWRITAAAHGPRAIKAASRLKIDAVIVSAVFPSLSSSAGRPMGAVRLARLTTGSRTPVIALGGVGAKTAARLIGAGAAGLAAVEALAERQDLIQS